MLVANAALPRAPRSDALVTNVDHTARNTNLMVWHGKLILIDHGTARYFHHHWEHAGSAIAQADVAMAPRLTQVATEVPQGTVGPRHGSGADDATPLPASARLTHFEPDAADCG